MTEKIKNHDFIQLNYTGMFKDGKVFDTTDEKLAKEQEIYSKDIKYTPATVCLGEGQLVPGLDEKLLDKEIGQEYTFDLQPEEAFGKRDVKRIKLVPLADFHKKQINPQPGMQVDMDGVVGTIIRNSAGRVMVNFNHPFAGKEISYKVKILKKVTDKKEQLESYLKLSLNLKDLTVEVKEDKAVVKIPFDLPEPLQEPLSAKVKEVIDLKEIKFEKK